METLSVVDPSVASGRAAAILAQVRQRIGRVPKMMRLLANSPAAADAYLQFNVALSTASLSPRVRALIAATVAEVHDSAYSRMIARSQARDQGISDEDLAAASQATSADPRVAAALRFAQQVVHREGKVDPAEVQALRLAGYGDAEIVEIVATVVLGVFRSYFNGVAGTEVDPAPEQVQNTPR